LYVQHKFHVVKVLLHVHIYCSFYFPFHQAWLHWRMALPASQYVLRPRRISLYVFWLCPTKIISHCVNIIPSGKQSSCTVSIPVRHLSSIGYGGKDSTNFGLLLFCWYYF
jgi:hypothetical protein